MTTHQHDKSSDSHGHGGGHHIVPIKTYIGVWIMLLIFTVITVAISYVDFGSINLLIAMVVASIKAGMVLMIFMGLKYDTAENSVTFGLSFMFLAIFVTLTAADIFWRIPEDPVAVDKTALASSGPIDVKKLATATPEALEKGKTLYSQSCAVCHGAGGAGDGPGGVALNPKPRNFLVDAGWKNGRKISGIFKTLAEGIPNSGMASYAGLSVEDRFALSHYVQSLGPKVPADTESELASLGLDKAAPAKAEIEVKDAMARLAVGQKSAEPTTYSYEPGDAPNSQYCKLPLQWRPSYCDTNPTRPEAR